MEQHEKTELKTIGLYFTGIATFMWGMFCFMPQIAEYPKIPRSWQAATLVPPDNISWPVFAILILSFLALLYFLNKSNQPEK